MVSVFFKFCTLTKMVKELVMKNITQEVIRLIHCKTKIHTVLIYINISMEKKYFEKELGNMYLKMGNFMIRKIISTKKVRT